MDEVKDAALSGHDGTSASPSDWVTPELLKYGGPAMWEILAAAFTEFHGTGEVPAGWLIGYVSWLWKGKKDVLNWRSHRGIVLASNVGKCYERVLLRRLRLWVALEGGLPHLQGVGNVGLDVRHQVELVYDTLLLRRCQRKETHRQDLAPFYSKPARSKSANEVRDALRAR